jgi:hypothetical protein
MIRIPFVIKLFLVTFLTVTVMVTVLVSEQKSFGMDLSSSTSQSSSHDTAVPQRTRSSPAKRPFTGELNVHPLGLQGRCVTVRFRGTNESMSMDEAVGYLQTTTATTMRSNSDSQGYTNKQPLPVGIVFVDEPDGFLSVARDVFHLFHFLEFLVVGYTELHRLASAGTGTGTWSLPTDNITTTLSTGFPSITVPWIYVPLMTETEICGTAGGINCLIADLVLQPSSASALQLQDWHTGIRGLESNDVQTAQSHAAFRGQHDRRKTKLPVFNQVQATNNYQKMVQDVDAAILINRADCMDGMHKMWNGRIDNFPVQQWHSDISNSLGSLESSLTSITNSATTGRNKLVVGYIDRQNANRALPPAEHDWLTRYLSEHALVEFYHLHNMEDYSPLKQIELTASCDVIIGAHGNGLSHVFWMQPKRYVVEIFWRFRYQFDYAFASAMMDHTYLGLFDGEPIDSQRIERTDPTLKTMHRLRFMYDQNMTAIQDRIATGRLAIQKFLQDAMDDLNIHL